MLGELQSGFFSQAGISYMIASDVSTYWSSQEGRPTSSNEYHFPRKIGYGFQTEI